MAVHCVRGKNLSVRIEDQHGNYVNFGSTAPDVTYPQVSMVMFEPAYFDGTWTVSEAPRSARDELVTMHEEVKYRTGIQKKKDPEDRPPSNRKEKRRHAAIARKKQKEK